MTPPPTARRPRNHRRRRDLAIVVGLVLILGLPSLTWPFGRDQGIHAYVGAAWLDGRLPFRDVWVQKGLLGFTPHLLVTALFGRTMWGIRVFDLFWQMGSGWLIYLTGRRRMSRAGALLAVGLYTTTYYAFGFWHTAHMEGHLLPFLLLGLLFYERAAAEDSARGWLLASGAALGLTIWFKQTAIVQAGAIFLWAAVVGWRQGHGRRWLIDWFWLGLGFLLPALLIVAYLAGTGALTPMLDIYRYSFFAYPDMGRLPPGFVAAATFYWGFYFPLLTAAFLAGTGYFLSSPAQRCRWLGIIGLAVAGLITVYTQGRFWSYQWLTTIPFMALLGGGIGAEAYHFLRRGWRQQPAVAWLLAGALLGLTLPLARTFGTRALALGEYATGRISWSEYVAELTTFELHDIVTVADYVADRSDEDDYLFIWGHYAMVYYLADRPNPTRFAMDPPLALPQPQQAAWRQEALADLRAAPPLYFLVGTGDFISFEGRTSQEQLVDFPELATWLDETYVFVRELGVFAIYRRAAPPAFPAAASLGDGIELTGYDLPLVDVRPGGSLSAALHWTAAAAPAADYAVVVQLVDWSGPTAVAVSDGAPVQGRRPTGGWQPGEVVVDTHDLALPADLPAGDYELIVSLHESGTPAPLPSQFPAGAAYFSLGVFQSTARP